MTDAFFTLHADLPREGPGDRASLNWAVTTGEVARDARILDAGCGPGADIEGLLAAVPAGRVVAVDSHAPFIARVNARWGTEPRVTARLGDMGAEEGPFDFIWSAGALYALGIEEGLRLMRGKLAPGGTLAFSELVWLVANPAPDLTAALTAEYPEVGGLDELKRRITSAGFDICGLQPLPDAAWEAYYAPMEDRIRRLRLGADERLAAVLDAGQAEIDLWRTNRMSFGYVLTVVRPA